MYQRTGFLLLTGFVFSPYFSLAVSRVQWKDEIHIFPSSADDNTFEHLPPSTDLSGNPKLKSALKTKSQTDYLSQNPTGDQQKISEETPVKAEERCEDVVLTWSFSKKSWSTTIRNISGQGNGAWYHDAKTKVSGQGNGAWYHEAETKGRFPARDELRASQELLNFQRVVPEVLERKIMREKNIKDFADSFDATQALSEKVKKVETAFQVLSNRESGDISPKEGLTWVQLFAAIMDVGDERIVHLPLEYAVHFGLIDLEKKFCNELEKNQGQLNELREKMNLVLEQMDTNQDNPGIRAAILQMKSMEKGITKTLPAKIEGFERLLKVTQELKEVLDLRLKFYSRPEAIKIQFKRIRRTKAPTYFSHSTN